MARVELPVDLVLARAADHLRTPTSRGPSLGAGPRRGATVRRAGRGTLDGGPFGGIDAHPPAEIHDTPELT